MYLLFFNVPESHLESVKNAIFAAGAGKAEHYKHCSWQTLGQGQFIPLAGSNAFIGEKNQLTTVAEYQVSTMCEEADMKNIIAALKLAHPYEVPSYQVIKLEDY